MQLPVGRPPVRIHLQPLRARIEADLRHRLKRLLQRVVDRTVVRAGNYVVTRVKESHRNVIEVVIENAIRDSADYADSEMKEALYFRSKEDLWDFALSKIEVEGLAVEFGVFAGYSINYFAKRLGRKATIYGFDSFEGLQEDWRGHILKKGAFSLGGRLPKVAGNVRLIKGWFDGTVPEFLAAHPDNMSFVHIDSDTYEAARMLLKILGGRLQKGTIVVFDEYFGYRGWRIGEWKAWREYVESTGVQYKYIGFAKEQVAIRITREVLTGLPLSVEKPEVRN